MTQSRTSLSAAPRCAEGGGATAEVAYVVVDTTLRPTRAFLLLIHLQLGVSAIGLAAFDTAAGVLCRQAGVARGCPQPAAIWKLKECTMTRQSSYRAVEDKLLQPWSTFDERVAMKLVLDCRFASASRVLRDKHISESVAWHILEAHHNQPAELCKAVQSVMFTPSIRTIVCSPDHE